MGEGQVLKNMLPFGKQPPLDASQSTRLRRRSVVKR